MNIYSLSIESIESIEFLRVTPGDPVAHHKPDGSHTPSQNGKILIVFGGGGSGGSGDSGGGGGGGSGAVVGDAVVGDAVVGGEVVGGEVVGGGGAVVCVWHLHHFLTAFMACCAHHFLTATTAHHHGR